MAVKGTPIISLVILSTIILGANLVPGITTTSSSVSMVSRSFTGIKLQLGQYMELIEEETCSDSVIRLTCRSLRATLLVLEAIYSKNRTNLCATDRSDEEVKHRDRNRNRHRGVDQKFFTRLKDVSNLRGNYVDDDDIEDGDDVADLRLFLHRRCSGFQHCRFNVNYDHPEAAFWNAANLRLKYACIPEAAISRYCNMKLSVPGGEGGYLKSPGYPHYYPGGTSCGWRFEALKGQRISLTLHDLDIRIAEQDGRCVDVVRVRENGITLLESCGSAAGLEILSASNVVTLDLIALSNLYPSRGFMLQYRAIGCPKFDPPAGSYVVDDTGDHKTLLCKKSGSVFKDTKKRSKVMTCKDGTWISSSRLKSGCVENAVKSLQHSDKKRLCNIR